VARASREKGKRGEREVVQAHLAAGIPARRDWESQSKPGGQVDGDVALDVGGEGFPIEVYTEVRRREQLRIPAWLREVAERKGDRLGVIVHRRNGEPWGVSLSLEDYLSLLKRAGAE
jgi:hypothetical protein